MFVGHLPIMGQSQFAPAYAGASAFGNLSPGSSWGSGGVTLAVPSPTGRYLWAIDIIVLVNGAYLTWIPNAIGSPGFTYAVLSGNGSSVTSGRGTTPVGNLTNTIQASATQKSTVLLQVDFAARRFSAQHNVDHTSGAANLRPITGTWTNATAITFITLGSGGAADFAANTSWWRWDDILSFGPRH